jgi:hypothetical protein
MSSSRTATTQARLPVTCDGVLRRPTGEPVVGEINYKQLQAALDGKLFEP